MKKEIRSIAMLGASGAVGGEVLKELLRHSQIDTISLFGRRELNIVSKKNITINQHLVSIFEPSKYEQKIVNHSTAICTLGVGEPTKVSKDDFEKIDKIAVLAFAKSCKEQGVKHFQLLASVGANARSMSFYLRIKGELIEELIELDFDRLSIFQPSMILTPTNRYGWTQALTLKVWPWLKPILIGRLKEYRGIKIDALGVAMARNIFLGNPSKVEFLKWSDFQNIVAHSRI